MIKTKEDIITSLKQKVDAFNDYIRLLNKGDFEKMPGEKWSAGQNLDHLIRSMKPLPMAYSLPNFILSLLFGRSHRPSRSFDELVLKYHTKLRDGGRASGAFVPSVVTFEQREDLLRKYERLNNSLIKNIKRYEEKDLDIFLLPHPLLGKLTLREMLYFTIYHNEHHLQLLHNR